MIVSMELGKLLDPPLQPYRTPLTTISIPKTCHSVSCIVIKTSSLQFAILVVACRTLSAEFLGSVDHFYCTVVSGTDLPYCATRDLQCCTVDFLNKEKTKLTAKMMIEIHQDILPTLTKWKQAYDASLSEYIALLPTTLFLIIQLLLIISTCTINVSCLQSAHDNTL